MKNVKQTKNICKKIKKFEVIKPTSRLLYIWDLLMSIAIVFCIFVLPIDQATSVPLRDYYGIQWENYIIWTLSIFVFDIFMKFNVGIYDKGMCEMNRKQIAFKYLKGNFVTDLLSIIPLINQIYGIKKYEILLSLLNILIIFKIESIYFMMNKYSEVFSVQRSRIIPNMIRLFRLFLTMLFIAHVIACLLLSLTKYDLTIFASMDDNWIQKYDDTLLSENWNVQYTYGLYWAVTTLTTVGYGDITPANPVEVLVITIIMFLACLVFGFSFTQIGNIYEDLQKQQLNFQEEMQLISRYFEDKHISKDLQVEVKKYLEYIFISSKQLSIKQSQQILTKIPFQLRDKLIINANLPYLERIDIFSKNFSQDFLKELSLNMQEEQIMNGQTIYKYNQNSTEKTLFFIQQGSIQLERPNSSYNKSVNSRNIFQILKKDQFFGEIPFFMGGQTQEQAKSVGTTQILKLKQTDFFYTIQKFQKDYEIYKNIIDNIKFNIFPFKQLNLECSNCKGFGHSILQCSLFHFIPDKEKTILVHNYPISQKKRKNYKRRLRNQDFNTLLCQEDVEDDRKFLLYDLSTEELQKVLTDIYGEKNLQQQLDENIENNMLGQEENGILQELSKQNINNDNYNKKDTKKTYSTYFSQQSSQLQNIFNNNNILNNKLDQNMQKQIENYKQKSTFQLFNTSQNPKINNNITGINIGNNKKQQNANSSVLINEEINDDKISINNSNSNVKNDKNNEDNYYMSKFLSKKLGKSQINQNPISTDKKRFLKNLKQSKFKLSSDNIQQQLQFETKNNNNNQELELKKKLIEKYPFLIEYLEQKNNSDIQLFMCILDFDFLKLEGMLYYSSHNNPKIVINRYKQMQQGNSQIQLRNKKYHLFNRAYIKSFKNQLNQSDPNYYQNLNDSINQNHNNNNLDIINLQKKESSAISKQNQLLNHLSANNNMAATKSNLLKLSLAPNNKDSQQDLKKRNSISKSKRQMTKKQTIAMNVNLNNNLNKQ